MAKPTPPSEPNGTELLGKSLDALNEAHEQELASVKALHEVHLKIVEEAHTHALKLARFEVAMMVQAVLAAKVAIGEPTPEERKVLALAELVLKKDGDLTREQMLAALKGDGEAATE